MPCGGLAYGLLDSSVMHLSKTRTPILSLPRRTSVCPSALAGALLAGVIVACGSTTAGTDETNDALTLGSDGSVQLNQNWNAAEQDTFHRSTEGGSFLPLAWLKAFEVPGTGRLVLDPVMLDAFGAVADPGNPDGLPIGLVKTPAPPGAPPVEFYGFNCAFCHTSELAYQGHRIRIEGAGANWNVSGFTNAIIGAIISTYQSSLTGGDPAMFDRFADRVLGPSAPAPAKEALRTAIAQPGQLYSGFAQAVEALHLAPIPEGTGRFDAVARLANFMFAPIDAKNFTAMAAPVSMPPLWDTEKLDFKHYSHSIRLSMARDLLTATSAGAGVDPATGASTVAMANLHTDEGLTAKLKPPSWPETVFGRIDRALAARGKPIYDAQCASCHERNEQAGVIVQALVDLPQIGTDPLYANAFHDKQIVTGPWGFGTQSLADTLRLVTTRILTASGEDATNNEFVPNLGYKARPLDGVWATAPYLHNGSVMSLYELLLPPSQRKASFGTIPHQEFDPKNVGLQFVAGDPSTTLDTTLPGNANTGHEYGTDLADADRYALIEYLKGQ
jgi:mono/diheme cytochrome c family protein